MATPVSSKPGWRFGVFEVDAHGGELRRAGVPLKLREQSFQILLTLLEHPGEIVTREELRRRLWPSNTFVDFDHSLNTAMMKLRDALGDSTDAPIYIETIPRHGYRFIAPVLAESTRSSADAPPRPVIPTQTGETDAPSQSASRAARRLNRLSAVTLTCLLSVLIAAAGYLWFQQRQRSTPGREPTNFRFVPLTSASAITSAPSISPDGRMIAYTWDGPKHERFELYVKLIGAELPRRISYDGGRKGMPAWSADGNEIAYTRCDLESGEGAIFMVPALGGPERRVTDAACPYNHPSPLAWSAVGGGRLIFVDRCAPDGPHGLIAFSLASGKRECLTAAGQPGFEHWFAFSLSPDGAQLAFNPSIRGACNLYIMPVAGGTPKQILHEEPSCMSLMWTPDQAIVFGSGRAAGESLWRIPVNGGEVRKEPLYPAIGGFSADGRRFVYEEVTRTEPPCLWRADLRAAGGEVLSHYKLTDTRTSDSNAQVSPDGTRIAWMSGRSGWAEIWIADANGDRPRQLTHLNSYAGTPRWSPDGNWIAFDFDRGSLQVFIVDSEGRNLRQITSGSGVNVVPSWSRDGKWVYFASQRSGRNEVWKHSLETGKEVQVTAQGGFSAFESFDGKTVYFSRFDQAGIWSIPSEGGAESVVVEGKPQTLFWGHWALTKTGIYYTNVEAEPRARIDFYDFATGRAHTVLALEKLPIWAGPSLSATADGKTIYYAQHDIQSVAKMMEFQP
jgi:Tol biopolymer transport system component/DNA-binding winged helix-turn-helix (wHTH) protein